MKRLALLLVLACPAPAGAHPGFVDVKRYAFKPASLTVSPGSLVEWRWDGPDTNHTVTGDGFDSDPGEDPLTVQHAKGYVFAHVFDDEGTFAYACRVHPEMRATVVVETPAIADGVAPRLDVESARVEGRRAVIRFRVDEPVSVLAEARRPGARRLHSDAFRFVRAGRGRVRLPIGRGRFRVSLEATDDAGNTSAPRAVFVRR